jgi:DNA-binding XRE family transcriptional regulator
VRPSKGVGNSLTDETNRRSGKNGNCRIGKRKGVNKMVTFTLKQAREYRGKTQEDMAKLLNVHVQTYRKIEDNPGSATIDEAKAICEYLNFDYGVIFFPERRA